MYTADNQQTTHNKNQKSNIGTPASTFLCNNAAFHVAIIIYPGRRWRNLNDSNVSSESTTCSVVHIQQKYRETKTRAPFARACGTRVVLLLWPY